MAGPDIQVVLPEQPTGTVWIQSTSPGEAAQESALLGGGVFTHHWVAALRGAADRNADGLVTLSEAYEHAAAQTHGHTAATSASPQRPIFQLELSGPHDLVLMRTGAAPTLLELPPLAGGMYLVRRLPSGAAVLSAEGAERPLTLALPAGSFQILRRFEGRLAAREIHLPWGGRRKVAAAQFTDLAPEPVALRGELPRVPLQLSASLLWGMALESPYPITLERLHAVWGFQLPEPCGMLRAAVAIGWQGRTIALATPGARVRDDAGQLMAGADLLQEHGPTTFLAGARLRAELHLQRERHAEELRYRAAGLTRPTAATLRAGATLQVEVRLALTHGLAWSMLAAASAMLQPAEGGAVSLSPVLEVSSGPSFVW